MTLRGGSSTIPISQLRKRNFQALAVQCGGSQLLQVSSTLSHLFPQAHVFHKAQLCHLSGGGTMQQLVSQDEISQLCGHLTPPVPSHGTQSQRCINTTGAELVWAPSASPDRHPQPPHRVTTATLGGRHHRPRAPGLGSQLASRPYSIRKEERDLELVWRIPNPHHRDLDVRGLRKVTKA